MEKREKKYTGLKGIYRLTRKTTRNETFAAREREREENRHDMTEDCEGEK